MCACVYVNVFMNEQSHVIERLLVCPKPKENKLLNSNCPAFHSDSHILPLDTTSERLTASDLASFLPYGHGTLCKAKPSLLKTIQTKEEEMSLIGPFSLFLLTDRGSKLTLCDFCLLIT